MEKRTYAVSEHTKQALGNALKTLMKEKSLEKIDVNIKKALIFRVCGAIL